MYCRHCVEISHFVHVAKSARTKCSIINIVCLDYELLLELHALTQVAHSYALLVECIFMLHTLGHRIYNTVNVIVYFSIIYMGG